ncbi:MAG: McrB family protein [Janthinobacterium lividum]
MFTLNETQLGLLTAIRAGQEEGERRYEFWSRREAQAAAAQAFGTALSADGFRAGRPLTDEARTNLLRAAAELAPNGNLSRRLFSTDPKGFDDRLRHLLSDTEPLYERLVGFLAQRGTGIQTASSLLSASDPEMYPLITRPALRHLALTSAQKRDALNEASQRYGFPAPDTGSPSAAQHLLALFIVYEQIRDVLGVRTYPEVDAALRIPLSFLAAPSTGQIREIKAGYDATPPSLTETRLLSALEEYALDQGFMFPAHRLRSYYIALKTRPFAILSGVSGTGKTRLAELFAEAMTGHAPRQFRLIPVRPDWNDAAALFGYQNVLANRYVSTPFLEIVRAAGQPENRQKAFFVCLDEMNLARVEHYLADYLSALESRSHRIPLHEGEPDLVLPPNLFVTGTVNVDETTHGFSRKVLDRANTFDFDEAPELSQSLATKGRATLDADMSASPTQRQALFLSARVSNIGRAKERLSQRNAKFPLRALTALQTINDQLYAHRLHFAYRVRDDILMFLANSFDAESGEGLLLSDAEENFRLALDLQIMQKVLPKLHGQSGNLLPLLAHLQAWTEGEGFLHTSAKLARMRVHGADTGYIRFYE